MHDHSQTFQVISGEHIFTFNQKEIDETDCIQVSDSTYHILSGHRSYEVTIDESNIPAKKVRVSMQGDIFNLEIKDPLDQMLDKMGFGVNAEKQIKEIKAPMPGLVLEISVTNGQEVATGDKMLILEAMKMENSINIPSNATIKKILVKKGQAVDKGQVLIELE